MPVETSADRAAMLSPKDWGVTATYNSKGKRYPISGIFDREYQAVDVAEAEVSSTFPVFHIQTADLPCRYQFGDTIQIEGETFNIRDIQPDGTGISMLRLEATK
jgi:hypothetical protein